MSHPINGTGPGESDNNLRFSNSQQPIQQSRSQMVAYPAQFGQPVFRNYIPTGNQLPGALPNPHPFVFPQLAHVFSSYPAAHTHSSSSTTRFNGIIPQGFGNNNPPPSHQLLPKTSEPRYVPYPTLPGQPGVSPRYTPTNNQRPRALPPIPYPSVSALPPTPYPSVSQPDQNFFSSSTTQQASEPEESTITPLDAIKKAEEIFSRGGNFHYVNHPSTDYENFIATIKQLEKDYSSEKISQEHYCTDFYKELNTFIKTDQKKFINPHNILAVLILITIDPRDVRNPLNCLIDCDIDKFLQGVITPERRSTIVSKNTQIETFWKIIKVIESIIGLSEKPKDLLTDQQTQILNLLRERLQQIYRQELNRSICDNRKAKDSPEFRKASLTFLQERASKFDFVKTPMCALEVIESLTSSHGIPFLQHEWVQGFNLFETISKSENEDDKKAIPKMIKKLEFHAERLEKTSAERVMTYLAQQQNGFPPLKGPQKEGLARDGLSKELQELRTELRLPKKKQTKSLRADILEIICAKNNFVNPLPTLNKFPKDELTDLLEGLAGEQRREQLQKIKDKVDHLIHIRQLFFPLEHQELYNQIVVEIGESPSARKEIHGSDEEQQAAYSSQTNSPLDPPLPSLSFNQNEFFASSSSQPQNNRQQSKKRRRE